MIAPEIFQFFEKITNPNSICKGFPIYEPYGKISKRAYSGKLVAKPRGSHGEGPTGWSRTTHPQTSGLPPKPIPLTFLFNRDKKNLERIPLPQEGSHDLGFHAIAELPEGGRSAIFLKKMILFSDEVDHE
jgi:hypothetical protein